MQPALLAAAEPAGMLCECLRQAQQFGHLGDPLSRMTVGALWDLGYKVNFNGPVDGYALG